MRKAFPLVTENLMKKDKKIFCLLGDIGVFSFRNVFKKYKKRILNMSTMEQSMIGFAAGLSKSGFTPIIHTIGLLIFDNILFNASTSKFNCNPE